jgi:phospholipid/cholesterol/gamma-HCH transport system substrate-binding protein
VSRACHVRRAHVALTAAVAVGALALTGCQGVSDLPLPGGAAQGSDVYHVTVEFRNVLDLVPQSAVKVDDVTVGAVDSVRLDGWHAEVRLRLLDSVKLPDNAVAELRQTSLLGEKFVSLSPPTTQAPEGRLGEGDVIPLARSGRNPEVEEVLGALSLLLNGGGVAQLKTINVELTRAMSGRESDIRSVVRRLDTFVGGLDRQKQQIVRAIDGIDRLSGRLAAQKDDIATAIDNLGPGLKVLADQRRRLTSMLTALSRLGRVGTHVIAASKADTVANLRALAPILTRLSQAGADLPNALDILFTYPFPHTATGAVKGDYTNLRITADLDLRTILANQGGGGGGGGGGLPSLPVPTGSGLPTSLPTGSILPSGLPSVSVSPLPTSTCTLICLGAAQPGSGSAQPTSYDMNLAALMTGGFV